MKDDQYFLGKAIEIGNKKNPPYNFGAVIVKNNQIIAAEYNHVHELHDPSAHAEILALKKAAQTLKSHNLDECTMYGSHEPCLMCFSCAAWADIKRVVYATAANEQNFSYEFEGVSLEDIAKKLKREISVEHVVYKGAKS